MCNKCPVQSKRENIELSRANKLRSAVRQVFSKMLTVNDMKRKALDIAEIDSNMPARRDFDGISAAGWLVEKMIGEMLTQDRINF